MHFLNDVPRTVFFTGKGGVGKTSLACANSPKPLFRRPCTWDCLNAS